MPYKSEKQRKYLHAVHPGIAARWDAEYGKKVKKGLNARAWREATRYAGGHSDIVLAKAPLHKVALKRKFYGTKLPVSRKLDQAALVHRTKRGAPAGQPLHRGIYVTREAHPEMEALKPGSKFNPSRGSISSWTTDSDVARRRANAEQIGWKPNPKRPQWGDSVHAPPTGRGYEIKLNNARSYRVRNEQTSVPEEKEHFFSGKVRVTHREGNVIHVEPAKRRHRVKKGIEETIAKLDQSDVHVVTTMTGPKKLRRIKRKSIVVA